MSEIITRRLLELERENAELKSEIARLKNSELPGLQTELPLGPIGISHTRARANRLTESESKNESNRFDFTEARIEPSSGIASSEENSIETLKTILGDREIALNGKLWRIYFRQCPRAIAYAVEDWKLRTPDEIRAIRNRPAWLTDRYKRARHEIMEARKSA